MQGQQYRIIVAEDDSIILMSLKMMLETFGHVVVATATDGEAALELTRKEKPDLLLVDINMPKMSGLDVLNALSRELHIPSIVITAYPDDDLIAQAADAGVYAYLLKPITEDQLKSAIDITMRRFHEYTLVTSKAQKAELALGERKLIERAKGLLMDQLGIKEAEALRALQKKSRDSNKKLAAVAQEVIESLSKMP